VQEENPRSIAQALAYHAFSSRRKNHGAEADGKSAGLRLLLRGASNARREILVRHAMFETRYPLIPGFFRSPMREIRASLVACNMSCTGRIPGSIEKRSPWHSRIVRFALDHTRRKRWPRGLESFTRRTNTTMPSNGA